MLLVLIRRLMMYLLDSDGKLNDIIDAVINLTTAMLKTNGDSSKVYVTKEGTSNLLITDSEDPHDILLH